MTAKAVLRQLDRAIAGDPRALDYGALREVVTAAAERERLDRVTVALTRTEATAVNAALALYDASIDDLFDDAPSHQKRAAEKAGRRARAKLFESGFRP